MSVTAADRDTAAPASPDGFSGVYEAALPESYEVALGVYDRFSAGRAGSRITIADFEERIFSGSTTLTFFEDGSGLAEGGEPHNQLQRWSGVAGLATFVWKRLENGNVRVRFVRTSQSIDGGALDVRRLEIEYEEQEGLLHPVDFAVMKVTTSSYVRFNVEQARNPFFSVVRDCPGTWQGQSVHLYRDLPKDDSFARMAYVRTSGAVPAEAREAAERVNGLYYMVPPEGIDRFFEDPELLCSGDPGVVY